MNLATIQASIYDQVGSPATSDTTAINRILRRINQVHREVLTSKGIGAELRRVPHLPVLTVANSPFAVLPTSAVRLFYVVDPTNNMPLDKIGLESIRYNDPGLRSTGSNPYSYALIGYAEHVAADPSAAGQLTVVSDSALDNGTYTVYIEGIRTGGYYRAASVALNGVGAVNIGPNDMLLVRKFFVGTTGGGQATANGNIILKDGAGNEIARIPPTRTNPRYTRLQFYPMPSTVMTLYADCEIHIEDMAQADDEPILPEDFHDIIELGVLRREYLRKEKVVLAKDARADYMFRVAQLRNWLASPAGVIFSAQRQRRFSQLGSYFPSGS